jgi:hypothetical protein
VRPFADTAWNQRYASNMGRYDASVVWKLNRLLSMGYTPVPDPISEVTYYEPSSKLEQLEWFTGCFGPYRAPDADVDVRLRGAGGLVCIDEGALHLREAPGPTTELVMELRENGGQASVRFEEAPRALKVVRLDRDDAPSPTAPADNCLTHSAATTTLTLKAVEGDGAAVCRDGSDGRVLEVPVADGSTAHVSVSLSAVDSPTIIAESADGTSVPFEVVDPRFG